MPGLRLGLFYRISSSGAPLQVFALRKLVGCYKTQNLIAVKPVVLCYAGCAIGLIYRISSSGAPLQVFALRKLVGCYKTQNLKVRFARAQLNQVEWSKFIKNGAYSSWNGINSKSLFRCISRNGVN